MSIALTFNNLTAEQALSLVQHSQKLAIASVGSAPSTSLGQGLVQHAKAQQTQPAAADAARAAKPTATPPPAKKKAAAPPPEEEEEEEVEEEEEAPPAKKTSAKKPPPPAEEEEEEEEEEEADEIDESQIDPKILKKLKEAKKLKDVLQVLVDEGITEADDLKREAHRLKSIVPVLGRIENIDERVERTIEIMDMGSSD